MPVSIRVPHRQTSHSHIQDPMSIVLTPAGYESDDNIDRLVSAMNSLSPSQSDTIDHDQSIAETDIDSETDSPVIGNQNQDPFDSLLGDWIPRL